ncbi:Ycf66 family protein [Stanieria cyanosphaera PCC 7437]|uniref:Ycf66 family protein n=1 Tax=Stanieria cyanosphaera (strain ATCC 29371 / PCC 7437) TaxID=111780 RepID=K9XN12_STAC7|nr:Ycf66 family protein [Stanieria cyanosphaera]AFZ33913.1 Ycf66 family protein [Stanieria cyanosphaera PCC 7437]
MLPYVLAIAVGLNSLILFLTAFLLPDLHRQDDFFWSAIGLFYALVLWFCATSMTGGLLLGQVAAVALLTSYNWQIFKLRKAIANPEQQANLDSFSVVNSVKGLFSGKRQVKPQPPIPPVTITEKEPTLPNQTSLTTPSSSAEEIEDTILEETSQSTPQDSEAILSEEPFAVETTSEANSPKLESTTPSPVATKKSGLFSNLFNFGKKQPASKRPTTKNTSSVATTKLDDLLDQEVEAETTTTEVKVTIAETTSTPESETTKIETISIKSSEEGSPTVETEEIIVETTPIDASSKSTSSTQAEIVEIIDTEIEPNNLETTNWDEEDVDSNPNDFVEPITVTEVQESPPTIDSNQTTKSLDKQKDLNIDEFLKEMEQKRENS